MLALLIKYPATYILSGSRHGIFGWMGDASTSRHVGLAVRHGMKWIRGACFSYSIRDVEQILHGRELNFTALLANLELFFNHHLVELSIGYVPHCFRRLGLAFVLTHSLRVLLPSQGDIYEVTAGSTRHGSNILQGAIEPLAEWPTA